MRDFHLPLVNKYGVKTLHVSQLNTVVTINAINYVKIITAAFHSNTAALHPKMVLFQKYELKL